MKAKKRKTLEDMANHWAHRETRKQPNHGRVWRIGYSWGAYDGFKAGFRAGRRNK